MIQFDELITQLNELVELNVLTDPDFAHVCAYAADFFADPIGINSQVVADYGLFAAAVLALDGVAASDPVSVKGGSRRYAWQALRRTVKAFGRTNGLGTLEPFRGYLVPGCAGSKS